MEWMKTTEWVEKTKKLKKEYSSIEELEQDCKKLLGTNWQISKRADNIVAVLPLQLIQDEEIHKARDVPLFLLKKEKLHKIDTEKLMQEIAKILAKKINIQDFLIDVLSSLAPDELQEVYERAVVKKGKVRATEGCYKLLIGGKRGYPMELMLRE